MSKRRKGSIKRPPGAGRGFAAGGAVVVREYYQVAFYRLIREVQQAGQYTRAPSAQRWAFWQTVTPGLYQPEEGRRLAERYLRHIEGQLRAAVCGHSLAYWLHLLRRLSPMAIGEQTKPATVMSTRAALEAAVQKWSLARPCGRVSLSTEVPAAAILKGYLVEQRDEEALRALAATAQLVLTDFGREELLEAIEAEKLAYEAWWAMALMRILGKGAPLRVTGDHKDPARDERGNELDFLVRNYDRREGEFTTTATGTVFEEAFREGPDGVVFLPQYNVAAVSFTKLKPLFERFLKRPFEVSVAGTFPNFIWHPFNVRSFYEAHRPFSGPFRERHSVSLESVLAVVATVAHEGFKSWVGAPRQFLRAWQRAYDGPLRLGEYEVAVSGALPSALEELGLPFDPAAVSARDGLRYLALDDRRRDDIGVGYSGPHSCVLPFGEERVFIDLAHLFSRLYLLFHGLKIDDQNFKGDAPELLTRAGVTGPLPHKEIEGPDGTSRQFDASFEVGEYLVVAECRANARSIAFDRGAKEALQKRREVVEGTLSDIDEKARWLERNRKATNYDVTKYRGILPVGVTPFTEYIPSLEPRYWISGWLPRVLTIHELRDAIERGEIARAIGPCPNVIHLR